MRSASVKGGAGHIDYFFGSLSNSGNKNTAREHSILRFQADGKNQAYLVFQTETAWCRACSALVGASRWVQHGDVWTATKASKCLAPLGSFATFNGVAQVAQLGPQRHGLVLHNPFEDWQHTLIVVDDLQAGLSIAWSKVTADGNTQGLSSCLEAELQGHEVPCWKYTSTMSFQPGSSPDFYDLILQKSGTVDGGQGQAVPVSEREIYRFGDGVYAE